MNIQVEHKSYELKENNTIKKDIELCHKYGMNVEFPKIIKNTCIINLKNSYTSFANAIRRGLIEEIPIKSLDVKSDDISSTDNYMLKDQVMKNLGMILLNQSIDDKLTFSLHMVNKTSEVIQVPASMLVCSKSKVHIMDNAKFYNITQLHPGKELTINNIYISKDIGLTDISKYSCITNIQYEILDHKPFDIMQPESEKNKRSIEYDAKEFRIQFETYNNISTQEVLKLLKTTFINRLKNIKKHLLDIKDKTYIDNEFLEIKNNNDLFIYTFKQEYITLLSMIANKVYQIDSKITFISDASPVDYIQNSCLIKIKHPEHNKILRDSIDLCIKDVEMINV